jgi:hypothetical protein
MSYTRTREQEIPAVCSRQMTTRRYLRGLNNEKLAELSRSDSTASSMAYREMQRRAKRRDKKEAKGQ